MGTRHNIRVMLDGQIRVRQYGQWDGYPTGQGIGIAEFLQNDMDKDRFGEALRACRFMTEEDINVFNEEHRDKPWRETHPWLSRDAGSNVLGFIQDKGARLLVESRDDEDPETWCQYFYLVDMDNETVTMTEGRNKRFTVTKPFSEWTREAMEVLEARKTEPFVKTDTGGENAL